MEDRLDTVPGDLDAEEQAHLGRLARGASYYHQLLLGLSIPYELAEQLVRDWHADQLDLERGN